MTFANHNVNSTSSEPEAYTTFSPDNIVRNYYSTLDDHERLHALTIATNTWWQQRKEYPGWLIAPFEKRAKLWRETRPLINFWIRDVGDLEPPYDIRFCYELNWRLEKALVPLFTEWGQTIQGVLEAYDPFLTSTDTSSEKITPLHDDYNLLDWDDIKYMYVELYFALARLAREDQTVEEFSAVMAQLKEALEAAQPTIPEWNDRYYYEYSLFYLFQLDTGSLRSNLDEWSKAESSPFGESKRAGLLAEIGDLDQASRIARNALQEIRERITPTELNVRVLSQEGWALLTLQRILTAEDPTVRDDVVYRERYRELSHHGCDPNTELRAVVRYAGGTSHRTKLAATSSTQGRFDPGIQTTTHHFGTEWEFEPELPDFALLRLIEEIGLPIRCGITTYDRESVFQAGRRIEQYAPFWSLSVVLRSAKTGRESDLDPWFDRVRIATLTTEQIDSLYGIFHYGFNQSLYRLQTNRAELGKGAASIDVRQAKILAYLLSRLSIRLSEEPRSVLFSMAIQIYREPIFREFLDLHQCVDLLFRRLLSQAMEPSETLRWLGELLSLPVPGHEGFEVASPEMWPEPLQYIAWPPGSNIMVSQERDHWNQQVEALIFMLREGGTIRQRAMIRLNVLYQANGLTEEQERAFADALWDNCDESGFPAELSNFFKYGFLKLPQPQDVDAVELFKKWGLELDLQLSVVSGNSLALNLNQYEPNVAELHGGTHPHVLSRLSPEEWLEWPVEWSSDEAEQLLDKVWRAWMAEKDVVQSHLANAFEDEKREEGVYSGLFAKYRSWIMLLADTIIPHLNSPDESVRTKISDVVDGLENLDISTVYAHPPMLRFNLKEPTEVSRRIWQGLIGDEPAKTREAVRATTLWLILSSDGHIDRLPPHLLVELFNRAIYVRRAGLHSTLRCLETLLFHSSHLLESEQLQYLGNRLSNLLSETELPKMDRHHQDEDHSAISIEERPDIRMLASRVAMHLHVAISQREMSIPEALQIWREVATFDPLPEVRKPWHSLDSHKSN